MNPWLYLFIIFTGILQAFGAPMNGQLYRSLHNPLLAALVSIALADISMAPLLRSGSLL